MAATLAFIVLTASSGSPVLKGVLVDVDGRPVRTGTSFTFDLALSGTKTFKQHYETAGNVWPADAAGWVGKLSGGNVTSSERAGDRSGVLWTPSTNYDGENVTPGPLRLGVVPDDDVITALEGITGGGGLAPAKSGGTSTSATIQATPTVIPATPTVGRRWVGLTHTAVAGVIYALCRAVGASDVVGPTNYEAALDIGQSAEWFVDETMEVVIVGVDATARNYRVWERM